MSRSRMIFRNLTPHLLSIVAADGDFVHITSEGVAPRLSVERETLGTLGVFEVVRSTMGAPEGLPEPQDGVILIVSAFVAEHPSVVNRDDLAYPGEAIRGEGGTVAGARGLCAGPGLAAKMRN